MANHGRDSILLELHVSVGLAVALPLSLASCLTSFWSHWEGARVGKGRVYPWMGC